VRRALPIANLPEPEKSGTQQYAPLATSHSRVPGPAISQSSMTARRRSRKSAFHGAQSL
jgi:hypothetical protein